MDDLDDFLDQGTQPLEQSPEPEQPETIGRERDESGRFAPKTGVEPQETAEVPPTDKLPTDTFKGLKEEREKRQALERELQTLRSQINPPAPPAPPPTIWDDEVGAFAANRQQAVTEASFNARLDTSEMLAAQAHDDFDDMRAKFLEMMAINPSLQQQALSARHPWGEAYKIAKNAARVEALGAVNVDEVEAKVRAQIEAEYAAKQQPGVTLPTSLADAQSSRSTSALPMGLTSLADIINGKG